MTPSTAPKSAEFPGFFDATMPEWSAARGDRVTTSDGRDFVDLAMGFGAAIFGHLDPLNQRAPHGLGDLHTTELRERVQRLLCAAAEEELGYALSSLIFQSGSEAVETALKTALVANAPRSNVVAFTGGYHGTFGMALAVTHRAEFREPFADWLPTERVRFLPYGTVPKLDESVACVVVEPIQGRAGVVVPPANFLREVRAACDESGALLVVDAVLVGSGRTDSTLIGTDVAADIVCLGKALGGGTPASAVLAREEIAAAWSEFGPEAIHTATFLAHPTSCLAIERSLDVRRSLGVECWSPLHNAVATIDRESSVRVRGTGALWALDTGTPGDGVRLARELLEDGFIVVPAAADGSVVTLTPSVVTNAATWHRFAGAVTGRRPVA
jgi:acetylornithine/succinyldiaminopimelate/putrescine aminotransferase